MYKVLCADPPWKFNDSLPGESRGASNNYPCLSVEELCTFPLPPLADDCVLFLWRVASMQQEALDVISVWGFDLKTELVWLKKTATGKRWFGMGRTVRAEHEVCLIATKGHPEVKTHSIRSTFEAENLQHSQKPELFYDIVEQLFDGPYVELFARRQRVGWTCLGNELHISNNSSGEWSL